MKNIFSILLKTTLIIIVCIVLFLAYVFYMFSDPGNHRKYEIGIPYSIENITNETLNNIEEKAIVSFIKDSIIGHKQRFRFDPDTRDTISLALDTLLDYKIGKVLLKNETTKIYFINYLSGIHVIGNDSVSPETLSEFANWCSVYINSKNKIIKDLSYYPSGYVYFNHLKLQSNDELLEKMEQEAIQYTLYGHNYYLISFWFLKIKNPNFWEDIEIGKSLVTETN